MMVEMRCKADEGAPYSLSQHPNRQYLCADEAMGFQEVFTGKNSLFQRNYRLIFGPFVGGETFRLGGGVRLTAGGVRLGAGGRRKRFSNSCLSFSICSFGVFG